MMAARIALVLALVAAAYAAEDPAAAAALVDDEDACGRRARVRDAGIELV